jgi:hypothetical protein
MFLLISMHYLKGKRHGLNKLAIDIIFNDKIATEQCCYNIQYRLHDVTALSLHRKKERSYISDLLDIPWSTIDSVVKKYRSTGTVENHGRKLFTARDGWVLTLKSYEKWQSHYLVLHATSMTKFYLTVYYF